MRLWLCTFFKRQAQGLALDTKIRQISKRFMLRFSGTSGTLRHCWAPVRWPVSYTTARETLNGPGTCILNSSFDFQRLYTFMYIRWLRHVWGSNIAQAIDILNVLIHRTLQFMMCNEFRYRTSLFSLPSANDEQMPRLILVSVLQQAYLP